MTNEDRNYSYTRYAIIVGLGLATTFWGYTFFTASDGTWSTNRTEASSETPHQRTAWERKQDKNEAYLTRMLETEERLQEQRRAQRPQLAQRFNKVDHAIRYERYVSQLETNLAQIGPENPEMYAQAQQRLAEAEEDSPE